jgi:hypothetical protein
MSVLCGAIRPRDGFTRCTKDAGHDYTHALLGEPFTEHGSLGAAIVTPYLAEWDEQGVETCDHCGHEIDNASGMCKAPLSVAD